MKPDSRIHFAICAGFSVGFALVAIGFGFPVPYAAGACLAVIGSVYIELLRQDRN